MRALLSTVRGGNGCGLMAMCGVAGVRGGPAWGLRRNKRQKGESKDLGLHENSCAPVKTGEML